MITSIVQLYKTLFFFITTWVFFVALAIISIDYEDIVLPKEIAEIWIDLIRCYDG